MRIKGSFEHGIMTEWPLNLGVLQVEISKFILVSLYSRMIFFQRPSLLQKEGKLTIF